MPYRYLCRLLLSARFQFGLTNGRSWQETEKWKRGKEAHFLFSASGPLSTAAKSCEFQHLLAMPVALVQNSALDPALVPPQLPQHLPRGVPLDYALPALVSRAPCYQLMAPLQQFRHPFCRSQCISQPVCARTPRPSCPSTYCRALIHVQIGLRNACLVFQFFLRYSRNTTANGFWVLPPPPPFCFPGRGGSSCFLQVSRARLIHFRFRKTSYGFCFFLTGP